MIFERIFNDDDFDRINNMVRWNGWRRLNDETVGHHSFLVSWFSRLIVEEIWPRGKCKLKLDVTTYAIFHDFDEMITGDVIHSLKYNEINGKALRTMISDYAAVMVNSKFNGESPSMKLMRPNIIGDVDPMIKSIVKLADWLSMSYYLSREIDMGNKNLLRVQMYCNRKIVSHLDKMIKDVELAKGKTTLLWEIHEWMERI